LRLRIYWDCRRPADISLAKSEDAGVTPAVPVMRGLTFGVIGLFSWRMRVVFKFLLLIFWAGVAEAGDVLMMPAPVLYLRGDFEQTKTVVGFTKPLISTGRFFLWRGRGVVWDTRKPFASTLLLKRDAILTRQGDGKWTANEGVRSGAEDAHRILFAILSADEKMLSKYFKVEERRTKSETWQWVLRPVHAGLARWMRRLVVEGDRWVRRTQWQEGNGDENIVIFHHLTEATEPTHEEKKLLGE